MKRFITALFIGLLLCGAALGESVTAPTEGQTETNAGSVLTAVGVGTVTLAPDVAVLTFQLSNTAITAAEAQATSAAAAERLCAALETAGVSRENMHIVHYAAETVYDYQYGKLGEGATPSGAYARQSVSVRLEELSTLGALIDSALQNGAESSYELRFESNQTQEAYNRALRLATEEAMRKAALLADVSGLTLGRLLSLRELESSQAAVGVADGASATANTRYQITVTARAEARYIAE